MVDNKYDIVGIGNSIVDVITDVEDQFLNEHELRKGLMSLVDLDGIKNISGKIRLFIISGVKEVICKNFISSFSCS